MRSRLNSFCVVCLAAVVLAFSTHCWSALRVVATWKADELAALPAPLIRLHTKDGPVGIVSRDRVVKLVDVLAKIQAAAGISTEFYLVHFADGTPNAFAKVMDDQRKVVGISIAMLELIGDDDDAYAAIFGHELTHIIKEHGANREARRGFLQALRVMAGVAIGAATGFNPGPLIGLGTEAIDGAFSREEEREADKIGFGYMVAAGFDPVGAIRMHEKLIAAQKTGPIPFLGTHPGGEERIENFKQMIAAPPPKTVDAAQASTEERPQSSVSEQGPLATTTSDTQATTVASASHSTATFGPQNEAPAYPIEAKQAGEEGKATVKVFVAEDGTPTKFELHSSSGYKRLDEAALAAVVRWKFNPAMRDGKPVSSWVLLPVVFKLESDEPGTATSY